MEYKFIVNTENVNSYGYRIITDGIDVSQYERNPVVLFMHDRGSYKPTGDEVIGKARLSKEKDQLIAYITFDSENEFAAKIENKVKGEFIKMCSMFADIVEASSDPSLVVPGQKYETVTKCKLVEISIVDIGGNDDAIRLSKDGNAPKIKLLNQKSENNMSELKTVALALGMSADSSEAAILAKVSEVKLSADNAGKTDNEWKEKFIALQKAEAEKIVDKAISLGLIPADLKDGQVKLFADDFEGQSEKLNKLIGEKETSNSNTQQQSAISGAVSLAKGQNLQTGADEKESFDYLQKHDSVKLAKIQSEEPQKYAELAKAYGAGVRYTGK